MLVTEKHTSLLLLIINNKKNVLKGLPLIKPQKGSPHCSSLALLLTFIGFGLSLQNTLAYHSYVGQLIIGHHQQ
jgi:hypothetical protein